MIDISITELLLVAVIALVVIGPERLPETIRTIMLWIGRIRRTFTSIKTEIEQEIGADDIRRQLHNESILKEINESKEQIAEALKDADQSVEQFKQSINDTIDASQSDQGASEAPAEPQSDSSVEKPNP